MSRPLTTTMGKLRGLLAQHAPLSATMLSVAAGVSRIRLASALRGECYLGAQREADLLTTAYRCVAALEAIRPFEIAAGDGATLKLLVDSGRDVEELRSIMMLALEPNQ